MSGTESEVIEQLVIAGAQGDRPAQQALLERYWPLIRQVVSARRRRMGRALQGREDTSDLQQEVAVELLRSLPNQQWRGAAAFTAWVRKLAECQVIDAGRFHGRQKRDRRIETGADKADQRPRRGPSMESRIENRRRAEALMEGIASLKSEYGAALMLNYQGYSHQQIGELLGCTAEAARKLVSRARAKLTATPDE